MSNTDFLTRFYDLITQANSIFITSHMQPDDDAVSSVLAMYWILSERYPEKRIEIRLSSAAQDRWKAFVHADKIQWVGDITATDLSNFDLGIFLDASRYGRFTKNPNSLVSLASKKVCIDHHATEPDEFDLMYVEQAPATATLLYQLFGSSEPLPARLAELFLLGTWSDTGGLRHVRMEDMWVYAVVAKLVKATGKPIDVLESKYNGYTEQVFTLLKEFVRNQNVYEVSGWPPFTCSFVSREFVQKHGCSEADVSSAYKSYSGAYSTSLINAPWGFALYPFTDGRVGASFRSRPDGINVRRICEGMGIGGGHDMASGGTFQPIDGERFKPEECLRKVILWLERNDPSK